MFLTMAFFDYQGVTAKITVINTSGSLKNTFCCKYFKLHGVQSAGGRSPLHNSSAKHCKSPLKGVINSPRTTPPKLESSL